jgi:D-alanyl-D-alanine-carboxypeptidase/D-alanyl-D-alanine-endopeptidase
MYIWEKLKTQIMKRIVFSPIIVLLVQLVNARPGIGQLHKIHPLPTAPDRLSSISQVDSIPIASPGDKGMDSVVFSLASRFINEPGHVGLSIAVLDRGNKHFYNYGSIGRKVQIKPTERTIYEMASFTKTFTGILLAKAVNEGRVRLSDDIRKYLPGNYAEMQFAGRSITIRDVASHTACLPKNLPALPKGQTPAQIIAASGRYSKENFLKELARFKPDTIPGRRFIYSNAGSQLIGLILERVYGMSYEKLVKKYITSPYHMPDTKLVWSEKDPARTAIGYNEQGEVMPAFDFWPELPAAAGLRTTAADMINYMAYNLDERDETVRLAHRPVFFNTSENGQDIGLFWFSRLLPDGARAVMHAGGSFGCTSYCMLFPDQQIGIACLANDASPSTEHALRDMSQEIGTYLIQKAPPQ